MATVQEKIDLLKKKQEKVKQGGGQKRTVTVKKESLA